MQLDTMNLFQLNAYGAVNRGLSAEMGKTKAQKKAILIPQLAPMKNLGIVGFLMILAAIPVAQFGASKYMQYLELQMEADREAACIACLSGGLTATDAKESLDASMRYLLAVLVIGSVGIVFVGLNWREMIAG